MTSLQSAPKQIPINNGFFRVVPSLLLAPLTAPVSSFMFTLGTNGALGPYTPQSEGVQLQLSTGACLLKDMGVKFLSSTATTLGTANVFRRVQVVNTTAGFATDGVGGTSTGSDSDYDVAYIQLGFGGAPTFGPFIRTG